MKLHLLPLLLSCCWLASFSQQKDTIFYNSKWKKTTKAYASYFRPLPLKKEGEHFIIEDYYLNRQLQMKGHSKSNTEDIFSGKVSWFYPNGQLQVSRTYDNGEMNGEVVSYFEDGTLKSKGTIVKNTRQNGTFPYTSGYKTKAVTYKNGSLTERLIFYNDTKTIAEKQEIKYLDQVQKSIFYDKKSNEIASINYINRSGNYLEPKTGTSIRFSYTNDFFVKDIIGKTIVTNEGDTKKEITYNNSDKIITSGIRKNGYPFEGSFFKDGAIINYKNGKRNGETTCCLGTPISVSGTYKNNTKYNGSFYDFRKRELSAYKDGTFHGELIVYDEKNKIKTLNNYKNGLLDGKYISRNRFDDNITYTGYYKNGTPYQGDFFQYETLKHFEEGQLTQDTIYDYKTQTPSETTFYNPDGTIAKKVFFKEGVSYKLLYKNGAPESGTEIQPFGMVTYNDGAYNGPFVIYDKHQTIKGNYKNFNYHGEVLFIQKGTQDTLKCTYENKKPIDGIDCFRGRISYKNGKKHGLYIKTFNNTTYNHDSLSVYYENDIKIDTITYFKKKKVIDYGVYKNGQPYHGTFYNDVRRSDFEIYDNGVLQTKEVKNYYDKFRHQYLYTQGKLTRENVYYLDYKTKDSLIYQLALKDETPFFGEKFKKNDTLNYYIVTNYLKGKKEGLETCYNKPHESFIKQFTYKNGILNGEAKHKNKAKNNTIISGIYKNNTPVNGEFITQYRSFMAIASYAKGKLKNKVFYTYSKYSDYQNFIDSLTYKNDKPYNGMDINLVKKKLFAKTYKNGILQKTHLSPSLHPFRSYNSIVHQPLKDSLLSSGAFKYVINYTNKKKTSGVITYFKNNSAYGNLSFKNNTIVDVNIDNNDSFTNEKRQFNLYFDSSRNLINAFKMGQFEVRRIVPKLILGDKHTALGNIQRFQFNYPEAKFTFYIDGVAYCDLNMRNNKPYHGSMFEPGFTGDTFKYRVFKNGKKIEDLKGLSKTELLKLLKTSSNK